MKLDEGMRTIAKKYFRMIKGMGVSVTACKESMIKETGKCGLTENFLGDLFQYVKWGLPENRYLEVIDMRMTASLTKRKKKVKIEVEEFLTPSTFPEGMPGKSNERGA